jgi:hypothetical protein
MMNHLSEVEDAAARAGVYTFQTQMEIIVLSLLHRDRVVALVQIEEARIASLDHLGSDLEPPPHSIVHHAKSQRVAVAMLERTFDRLRAVIQAPDENGSAPEAAH